MVRNEETVSRINRIQWLFRQQHSVSPCLLCTVFTQAGVTMSYGCGDTLCHSEISLWCLIIGYWVSMPIQNPECNEEEPQLPWVGLVT